MNASDFNPGFADGFASTGFLSPGLPMNTLELAKATLPLFGGTTPESPPQQESSESLDHSSDSGAGSQPSGGDSGSSSSPTEMTPEQISGLLAQVSDMTAKLSQLQHENDSFKQKEQQKQRESMGREEALTHDLEQAQQTIIAMDNALKKQAVINAINNYEDIKFHDPNFVVRELSPEIFENMEVDLERGAVTVTGIENELKRIAREKDWAVKKRSTPETPPGPQRPPRSGNPPTSSGASNDKASRREALINKFPVIGHGRAAIG